MNHIATVLRATYTTPPPICIGASAITEFPGYGVRIYDNTCGSRRFDLFERTTRASRRTDCQ